MSDAIEVGLTEEEEAPFKYEHINDAPVVHLQIVQMLAFDVPAKAIATHLKISPKTVRRCQSHPPLVDRCQYLAELKSQQMMFGFENFLQGVNSAVAVMYELMMNSTTSTGHRIRLAMWFAEHDPSGLYSKKDGFQAGDQGKKVFDTETQSRLIENAQSFDASFKVFDTPPDPTSEITNGSQSEENEADAGREEDFSQVVDIEI